MHVAQLLRDHIRKEDTAARIGLGGFVLSLPAGRVDGIQGMVDRLRAEVIAAPPEINGLVLPITLSTAVFGPDVQLGISAQDALALCELKLAEVSKAEREPKLDAVTAAPKPATPVPAPQTEALRIDALLDQIKLGNAQPALEKMPQILNRIVPLLRLLSAGQRSQLIQFLQKL